MRWDGPVGGDYGTARGASAGRVAAPECRRALRCETVRRSPACPNPPDNLKLD